MFLSRLSYGDGLDDLRLASIAGSLVCALLYLVRGAIPGFRHWRAVKAGAMGALMMLPLLGMPAAVGHRTALIALELALLLSVVGDVLMMAPPDESDFTTSLATFFCVNLSYVLAFTSFMEPQAFVRAPEAWIVAGTFALAIAIYLWLRPALANYRGQVAVYISVLVAMATVVIVGRFGTPLVAIGAVLYFCSDLAIARERFVGRFPGVDVATWVPYYGGQLLLCLGLLEATRIHS